MPKIDYSKDNIFNASKELTKIGLKNIQPPAIINSPNIDMPLQNNQQMTNPQMTNLLTGKKSTLLNQPQLTNSSYSDFIKSLKVLSNELDEFLTDLDNMYEEVEYPRIDLHNKRKHNPRYNRFYKGLNRGAGIHKIKGGQLTIDELNILTDEQLIEIRDSYGITNSLGNYRGMNRNTIINRILRLPEDTQYQIYHLYIHNTLSSINNNSQSASNIGENRNNTLSSINNNSQHIFNSSIEPLRLSNSSSTDSSSYSMNSSSIYPYSSSIASSPHSMNSNSDLSNSLSVYPDSSSSGYYPDSSSSGYPDSISINYPDSMNPISLLSNSSNNDENNVALRTNELKIIANQISNAALIFKSSISSSFNKLQKSQVSDINDEIDEIKPKIDELLTDEFIQLYHVPQIDVIKKSFDKFYSSVKLKINSYVPPRINGGNMCCAGNINYNTRHSINNYAYYK